MKLSKRVIRSNKNGNFTWSFILGAVFAVIIILFVSYLIKKAAKSAEGMADCKVQGGNCYASCEGAHAYEIPGATGCEEDGKKICCRGEMLETEENGQSSGGSGAGACAPYEICYVYLDNKDDTTWKTAVKWYSGNKEKNCYYLFPQYDKNKEPPEPITNGQVLFQGNEKVTLTASATAKCCRMQIGGINEEDNSNGIPEFPYFTTEAKREATEYISADETGICTANLTFDFANPGNVFKESVRDASFDYRSFCIKSGELIPQSKAMFKVDFIYWSEGCGDDDNSRPDYLAKTAASISTLFDVAEFDPDTYIIEDKTTCIPGSPTCGESEITGIDLFLVERDNLGTLFSGEKRVCELFCQTIKDDDTKTACKFVGVDLIDNSENNPDCVSEELQTVRNGEPAYKLLYKDIVFVEDHNTKLFYKNIAKGDTICAIGAEGVEKVKTDWLKNPNCEVIYYLGPNLNQPELCDVDSCTEIESKNPCNNIWGSLELESQFDSYYSEDNYCEDLSCYYGKKWWQFSNKCRDCSSVTKCANYNEEEACVINPCTFSPNTAGCFWNEKDEDCKKCPGSCEFLLSKEDCEQGHDCNLFDCVWENTCITSR